MRLDITNVSPFLVRENTNYKGRRYNEMFSSLLARVISRLQLQNAAGRSLAAFALIAAVKINMLC